MMRAAPFVFETKNREFSALELLSGNYPKYGLFLNEFPSSQNGIKGCNKIDWLLSE